MVTGKEEEAPAKIANGRVGRWDQRHDLLHNRRSSRATGKTVDMSDVHGLPQHKHKYTSCILQYDPIWFSPMHY